MCLRAGFVGAEFMRLTPCMVSQHARHRGQQALVARLRVAGTGGQRGVESFRVLHRSIKLLQAVTNDELPQQLTAADMWCGLHVGQRSSHAVSGMTDLSQTCYDVIIRDTWVWS